MPSGAVGTRALVTGATGFLGGHLTRHLLATGWTVDCIVRASSSALPPGARGHVYDGSTDSLLTAVDAARPDVVFHLASVFVAAHKPESVDPLIRSNVLLGAQLLEGMAAAGCTRLVNTGTCWQHLDDADYQPVNLYAATKQAMEDILDYYVSTGAVDVVTLKIYDTYGPNDTRDKVLALLVRAALEGTHLDLSPGEQFLELVYVDDVVAAFTTAAQALLEGRSHRHRRYALRARERLSLRETARIVERVAGRPIDAVWGARPYREREVMTPWRAGEPLPGWSAVVGLEDGVRRLVASMRCPDRA